MLSSLALADLRVDGIPSLAELMAREGPVFKIIVEGQAFKRVLDSGKVVDEFYLTFGPSLHTLFCYRGNRTKKKTAIDVEALKEVRVGLLTHTMLDYADKLKIDEKCALSLVYETAGGGALPTILNLVSPSAEKRELWAHALNLLIQTLSSVNAEAYSLMRPWSQVLPKGRDYLDVKQTDQLLESLQIPKALRDLDEYRRKDRLFFADFIRIVRRLRSHPVAGNVFSKYGASNIFSSNFDIDNNALMDIIQFQTFLQTEQEDEMSQSQVEALIRRYSLGSGKLDEVAFQNWIISAENDLWKPAKLEQHHNMNEALNLYWINSSHNTYLSGGQLNGLSSIEMCKFFRF